MNQGWLRYFFKASKKLEQKLEGRLRWLEEADNSFEELKEKVWGKRHNKK
jgi:hypothetical protein